MLQYYILKNPEFAWPAAFWLITGNPKLSQICWWSINNKISFHYRLFPRKINTAKFFEKPKNPYFGAILGAFCPNLGQKWIFLEKRTLSVFQYSNYLPLCQKSGKPNEPFLRKLLDRHTKNQFLSLTLLAKSILGHISRTGIFLNMKFVRAYSNYSNINFHYRPNW